jgi:hypothetical protein
MPPLTNSRGKPIPFSVLASGVAAGKTVAAARRSIHFVIGNSFTRVCWIVCLLPPPEVKLLAQYDTPTISNVIEPLDRAPRGIIITNAFEQRGPEAATRRFASSSFPLAVPVIVPVDVFNRSCGVPENLEH